MSHEQAELTGTVHQGVIVVDGGVELTEGQTVKIIIEQTGIADTSQAERFATHIREFAEPSEAEPPNVEHKAASPLGDLLLKYAGMADDLPADMAKNHDHYLYGTTKVDEAVESSTNRDDEAVGHSNSDELPQTETVGQRLMKFAGIMEGLPPDFALNHDHYLYGAEKRNAAQSNE